MENFLVGISLNRMKRSLEAQRTLETNSFIVHLNENINTVGSHADEYVGHSDLVGCVLSSCCAPRGDQGWVMEHGLFFYPVSVTEFYLVSLLSFETYYYHTCSVRFCRKGLVCCISFLHIWCVMLCSHGSLPHFTR
jgi:hypothetical protein